LERAISTEIRRAIAFVDGQNLYHAARKAFGQSYPSYDVQALASAVCSRNGWSLAQTRFYTGLHDVSENPFWHSFWISKIAAMRGQGVEVYTRPIRYRNKKIDLPDGTSHSFRTGEEKGIDVRIALDVVRLASDRSYDVGLIFSQDQDFSDVAIDVRAIATAQRRWIKLASAFPVGRGTHFRRGIDRTDWIAIDEATYCACLDPRDHRS